MVSQGSVVVESISRDVAKIEQRVTLSLSPRVVCVRKVEKVT